MNWAYNKITNLVARYLTSTEAVELPDLPANPMTDDAFEIMMRPWEQLMHAHVSHGSKNGIELNCLNYEAFRSQNPNEGYVEPYRAFLESLEICRIAELSQIQRKALYINAYNAFAIKVIVDYSI